MNFSFESVKLKAKPQNEDFYFDVETPQGHFFAVLDFASHDYANLNATLKGKLETIVGSFASLSDFSDNLFLGFLAKEINNFVSNLAEQSGGPELFFNAALCLVSGNRLSYFLSGDVRINVLSTEGLVPLQAAEIAAPLGTINVEAPMAHQVQTLTLQDADVVLITTEGVATHDLADRAMSLRESEPKSICESLMQSNVTASEDCTVVVIGGPYVQPPSVALPDLRELSELRTSLAMLAVKVDALAESNQRERFDAGHLETSDSS